MKIEFTKEELKAVIIQLGARIDYFNDMIAIAGKEKNIRRIKDIMNGLQPLESFQTKLNEALMR